MSTGPAPVVPVPVAPPPVLVPVPPVPPYWTVQRAMAWVGGAGMALTAAYLTYTGKYVEAIAIGSTAASLFGVAVPPWVTALAAMVHDRTDGGQTIATTDQIHTLATNQKAIVVAQNQTASIVNRDAANQGRGT